MRHSVLVALALIGAGFATGCPAAKPPITAQAHEDTPAEVVTGAKAALEQWRQAYEVRSLEALGKLYGHEDDLVVVLDAQMFVGWTAFEAHLQDKLTHAKDIRVRLKDIRVKSLAPTIATATAVMNRESGDGVTTVTENGTLTVVLRKDPEGWKLVQEHYSYRRP